MKYRVKWRDEAFWIALGTAVGGFVAAVLPLFGVEVNEQTSTVIIAASAGFFGGAARLLIGFFLTTPKEPR
jgi:succinate-acetate transporter protein